jgi:hypothetical protein
MNSQDNQTFPINMIEANPQPCLTFYEKEEPLAIHIIKSGWSKPQLYHVLVEFGDMMETTYHTLEAEQIAEKFGINIEDSFKDLPVVFRKSILRQKPNDSDLGKYIRANINQSK